MRKGLTLQVIGGVILALIGVAVFIAAFSGTFGGAFEDTFCNVYSSLAFLFPGQGVAPAGCGSGGEEVEYDTVTVQNANDLELQLASLILNCWQEYKGYFTESQLCGGWNIEGTATLDETSLTQTMCNENLIPQQIQNSQRDSDPPAAFATIGISGCDNGVGASNQIRFKRNDITNGDLVIVQYNSSTNPQKQWIEVN